MKAVLNYFSPSNKTIVTSSGFRYIDTTSVIAETIEIEGDNELNLFIQFYKLNNRLRYCNGSYYKFKDKQWERKYVEWLQSDDYKNKSFELYYGNGIVD